MLNMLMFILKHTDNADWTAFHHTLWTHKNNMYGADLFLFLPELDVLGVLQLTVEWEDVRQRLNHSTLNLQQSNAIKLSWVRGCQATTQPLDSEPVTEQLDWQLSEKMSGNDSTTRLWTCDRAIRLTVEWEDVRQRLNHSTLNPWQSN